MSTVTIRLNQEEIFFKSYAQLTGQSPSSISKRALEHHFSLRMWFEDQPRPSEHFR